MRILVAFAVLIAVATSAEARSLPVSGWYGTESSCARTHIVDLLIGPPGIGSLDLSCMATKVRGIHVRLICSLEGNTVFMNAKIIEDRVAGVLAFIDDFGSETVLRRCK